jgi:hypothetical protein
MTSGTSRSMGESQVFEESKFIVSNEWREMAFGTGVNFCHRHFSDFHYVIEHINDFIQQTKIDAHLVPSVSVAYPILSPVAKGRRYSDDVAGGGGGGGRGADDDDDLVHMKSTAMASVQPVVEVDVNDVVFSAGGAAGGCGEGDCSLPCARSLPGPNDHL